MALAEVSPQFLNRGSDFVSLGCDSKIGMRLVMEAFCVLVAAGVRGLCLSGRRFRRSEPPYVGCYKAGRILQQFVTARAFGKFVRQKAFIRGVLQQSAHEVSHSWQ